MPLTDPFSAGYAPLLGGDYDCVDRIVINGYFPLGQSPGGFRTWWRLLYHTDANLDNNHLMRLAGRFSRRLRAWAAQTGIPVLDCRKGDRKHEIAEELLPRPPLPGGPPRYGVFAILVARASAPIWKVRHYGKSGLDLERRFEYVNHYYFHILDPQWGHVTFKLCGHPPFNAQVILNGHDFVERRAQAQGIAFRKEDNCFTELPNAGALCQIADTLRLPSAIGQLEQVCQRWIYSACLALALDTQEQQSSGFRYDYSVFQLEYSRNLLFQDGQEMEQIVQALIDRNRCRLDWRTVRTLFGLKPRPGRRQRGRFQVTVETPTYDLTVFKIHFDLLTIKVYTKGERVLRIETIVHNTRVWHCRRALPEFPHLVERLRQILYRFLEVLRRVDVCWVTDETLERLPEPLVEGQRRTAGIDLNRPRMRAVLAAVLHLAPQPGGFRAAQLAARVAQLLQRDYSASQASYDLRKLAAKKLVQKIPRSRRYQSSGDALRTVAAVIVLREQVLRPILASARHATTWHKPQRRDPIDNQYARVQWELRQLFQKLNLVA